MKVLMNKLTKKNQKGMTFIGLVLVIAAIICIGVIGLKVLPAYMEFMNVKNAIKKAVTSVDTSSKKEVATAFDKSAAVDNIKVIKGSDLLVSGGTVSAQYQVVIPIVANASVLLDFNTSATK